MSHSQASDQAYDDIGVRFCLRKTSLRKAKNFGLRPQKDRESLMFEVRSNLMHLKETIGKLEKAMNEGR